MLASEFEPGVNQVFQLALSVDEILGALLDGVMHDILSLAKRADFVQEGFRSAWRARKIE